MSRLPSASKLQLALTCPASVALPQSGSESKAADDGNARHRLLADVIESKTTRTDPPLREWLDRVLDDEATMGLLVGSVAEVSLHWHPATDAAQVLGIRLERAYESVPEGAFFGTADYLRADADGVMVADLKTGLSEVPHPSRNAQLRFLALAACRVHGLDRARVGLLHAPEGRAPWWEWADIDAFELEVIAAELRRLVERIEWARRDVAKGKTPRVVVGEHCTWCPARFSCPARSGMAVAMATAPGDFAASLKTGLADDGIASMALARWQAARKVLDEVGSALYARAKERPIPLDDGRAWGPVVSEREVIDAEAAWPVLAGLLGNDGARAAMTLETSRAGVERGVRAAKEAGALKGTIKAGVGQALDALRAGGAVTKKTVEKYEAHTAGLTEGNGNE